MFFYDQSISNLVFDKVVSGDEKVGLFVGDQSKIGWAFRIYRRITCFYIPRRVLFVASCKGLMMSNVGAILLIHLQPWDPF